MKETTGEVSMTVITIVLLVVVLGLGMALFGSANAPGRTWLNNMFNNMTQSGNNAYNDVG